MAIFFQIWFSFSNVICSRCFQGLREITQRVVTSIQGQISMTKVLPRLIEDPETTGGTLGDLRQLIMGKHETLLEIILNLSLNILNLFHNLGLLDNYTYETTLLRISTRLLQGDVHSLLSQRFRQSRKAVPLRVSRCSSCNHSLQNGPNPAITAFQCRHAFHSSCLQEEIKFCIVCKPTPIVAHQADEDGSNIKNQVLQLSAF